MKQSINLYRGDLVPVQQRLTLAKLATGLVALVVVVFALVIFSGWQHSQAQDTNNELTERLNVANDQLTSLRDRLSNRKQSPELVSKKAELQAYIQDARTFRQSISDFEASESSAVASLLSELSDITPQGVWLERFGLDGEKIYLKGYATDTEKLVLWMDKFDESELLASKRFAVVELSRSEEGYQSFQLRTERREEPAEE
jgi:Tfp pilus assembly protein PilN